MCKGIIYRDNRLCHWSCALQSAISDAEVDTIQLDKPKDLEVPGYPKRIKFGVIHKFRFKYNPIFFFLLFLFLFLFFAVFFCFLWFVLKSKYVIWGEIFAVVYVCMFVNVLIWH